MKTNVLTKPSVVFVFLESYERKSLFRALHDVSHLYPGFEGWLTFKFLRDLPKGRRKLLVAHNGDAVIGWSLLKQDAEESKICTFYIAEECRGLGIGQELMNKSVQALDSRETFITVSDERLEELSPLLKSKGFTLSSSVPNMYRKGSTEHIWTL